MAGIQLGTGYIIFTNSSATNFTPMAVPHFVHVNTTAEIDRIFYDKLNRFGKKEFVSELGCKKKNILIFY